MKIVRMLPCLAFVLTMGGSAAMAAIGEGWCDTNPVMGTNKRNRKRSSRTLFVR
jgi:hypothetical protein